MGLAETCGVFIGAGFARIMDNLRGTRLGRHNERHPDLAPFMRRTTDSGQDGTFQDGELKL
jgi:hypothetical protein